MRVAVRRAAVQAAVLVLGLGALCGRASASFDVNYGGTPATPGSWSYDAWGYMPNGISHTWSYGEVTATSVTANLGAFTTGETRMPDFPIYAAAVTSSVGCNIEATENGTWTLILATGPSGALTISTGGLGTAIAGGDLWLGDMTDEVTLFSMGGFCQSSSDGQTNTPAPAGQNGANILVEGTFSGTLVAGHHYGLAASGWGTTNKYPGMALAKGELGFTFQVEFGDSLTAGGSSSAVPEPASLGLMGLASTALLRRRRR